MNFDVILLVLQVVLAVVIITLILLQKGKGASEGATFGGGGGGAGSVFGASGSSNFLSKTTAILATAFFLNSLALAYLAGNRDIPNNVMDTIGVTTEADSGLSMPSSEGSIPLAADTLGVPAPADAPVESDVPPAAE